MDRRASALSSASSNILNSRKKTTQILNSDEKAWKLSNIRAQIQISGHEDLLCKYTDKLNHSYFTLFLILIFIVNTSHLIVVTLVNMESKTIHIVLPDIILYSVAVVVPIIGVFISENYIKKYPAALKHASLLVFIFLFIIDLGLPIYHSLYYNRHYRPTYTTQLILACYVFLTVGKNKMAMFLGTVVTASTLLVLAFCTYQESTKLYGRLGSDLIYYICINVVGVYLRYMNEIVYRRGFLDRKICVESNFGLEFAKEQEEQLMTSILPQHIIDKIKKKLHTEDNVPRIKPFKSYIEPYENVTILYADIVNYTQMTTKLTPAKKLVETLHDLFGSFDEASEQMKVLRIKFLGDCYYCVGGLPPESIKNHADACVDLGLEMIQIIKKVRVDRDLDINMRIGIHSGNIQGGIIGMKKWQFDVWSKDVFIANRMETTGSPGKVHITQQTKDQLTKAYYIEHTNVGSEDALFKKIGIQTYLVSPSIEVMEHATPHKGSKLEIITETEPAIVLNPNKLNNNMINPRRVSGIPGMDRRYIQNSERRISGIPERRLTAVDRRLSGFEGRTSLVSERRPTGGEIKRRTAFMGNFISKYQTKMQRTTEKLEQTIEAMPLSKYDQWFKMKEINPLLMIFKDLKEEVKYICRPDPLFKYYVITEILILACILLVQNVSIPYWDWTTLTELGSIGFLIVILLPLTWTPDIWNDYSKKKKTKKNNTYVANNAEDGDDESSDVEGSETSVDFYEDDFEKPKSRPENRLVKFLYLCSKIITKNVVWRIIVYVLLCGMTAVCVFSDMSHCDYRDPETIAPRAEQVFLKKIYHQHSFKKSPDLKGCVIPWHMTETCAMAILISFLFLRIHAWLKLLFSILITVIYSMLVMYYTYDYFEDSETFNHMMKPSLAHILSIIYLFFTLHLIDRQSDYLNRLDHTWNEQLITEELEATKQREVNLELLENILPIHIAHLYLNVNNNKQDLYCEDYSNVAVMFASIITNNIEELDEKVYLTAMDQIISDFDEYLYAKYKNKIEKIKIANWTYMAASGLNPGRKNTDASSEQDDDKVVVTLLEFAKVMMQLLASNNRDNNFDYKLRIGICHGEVTAGVVGSKKPLYDIWGDTVNMASRMDSTGVADKIQVNEKTANALKAKGYKCDFRGYIYVKGKSPTMTPDVPTYFVDISN